MLNAQSNKICVFVIYGISKYINLAKIKVNQSWEYQSTWPASWEIWMQIKKEQLEMDMEQQNGSSQERSTSRLYIVTLLI